MKERRVRGLQCTHKASGAAGEVPQEEEAINRRGKKRERGQNGEEIVEKQG